MHATPARTLRRALWTAALALAACGVGSKEVPVYVEGIIGPGGGSLQCDHAICEVPPGAFADDTLCAMVPFNGILPVDPAAGEIFQLPGCLCIGPRGTPLSIDGFVRFCYDPSTIPLGSKEDSVVLLEWDNVQGFLVVTPATKDFVTHCFEDVAYDDLGYVVAGVRIGKPPPPPALDYVFFGGPTPPAAILPSGLVLSQPGLVLADADGVLPPLGVEGTAGASRYAANRDGTRVLFTVPNFLTEGTTLSTFPVAAAGPFTPVPVLPEGTWTASEPLYGWLGAQDRVYHEHQDAAGGQVDYFAYKEGDGSGSVVDLASRSGIIFLEDLRISPDQSKVLLRWIEFNQVTTWHIDVIDAATGTPIGTDLPTATNNYGDITPRWLPDSSGIYFIEDDFQNVSRMDPDGGNVVPLYS